MLVARLLFGATFFLVAASAAAQEPCFERLDNGVDLTGWQVSTTNHHGPGEGWTVEDGAIVGRQTGSQLGGILLTEASYSDVEVILEVRIDWGCDSGLFFRTTGGDRAYQVCIDHLAESSVGTIYGEAFASELRAIPYWLTDLGSTAIPAPNETPMFDLSQWSTIWNPTEFNEIRARVEGNPPHMQVWISDLLVMDFTDAQPRAEIDASGPLAIQVHSGTRWIPDGTVRFRNIRVRDLTLDCMDPGAGGAGGVAGSGGQAGAGGSSIAGAGNAGASGGAVAAGGSGGVTAGTSGSAGSGGTPLSGSAAAPAPASADSGGCACTVVGTRSAASAAPLLLLGLAGLRRRRRGYVTR